MKKLMLKMFAAIFAVGGLLLTNPRNLLAQYGGAAPAGGQVLGEETPSGIPVPYLIGAIILTLLGLAILFFIKRHRSK